MHLLNDDVPPTSEEAKKVSKFTLGGFDFREMAGSHRFEDPVSAHPKWDEAFRSIKEYLQYLGLPDLPIDENCTCGIPYFIGHLRAQLAGIGKATAAKILSSLELTPEDEGLIGRCAGSNNREGLLLQEWLRKNLHPFPDTHPGFYPMNAVTRIDDDEKLVLVLQNALSCSPSPIILSDPTRETLLERLGPLYRPILEQALFGHFKLWEDKYADPGYLAGMPQKPSHAARAIQDLLDGGLEADSHERIPLLKSRDMEGRWIGPGALSSEVGLGRIMRS